MLNKGFLVYLGRIGLIGVVGLVFSYPAWASTGTTYQVSDDQPGVTQFSQSSGTMTIDGSLEPVTGEASSGSYLGEIGSPTNPGSESSGATNETTSGSFAGKITVDQQSCGIAYSNLVNISGTKTSNIIYMFVRGDMSGFYFPDTTHWQKTLWLSDTNPIYDFVGKNDRDLPSNTVLLSLLLKRMGDVNSDGITDEYDLSFLISKWNATADCGTDMNRDGTTDEYDLSLLISNWST